VIINASSGSTFTITLGANITIFSADNMQNAVGLTIDFNGYNITCVGNNVNIWRSNTTTLHLGTPDVYFTYSGGVGTRSIIGNTQTTNQLNVYVTAGTDIVALINNYNNVDFTGFSGSHANASNKSIYGNLLVSSGMTWTDGAATTTFAATSGTKLITTNGKVLTSLTFGGVGGTWQLQDALSVGAARTITLTSGTLDLNGKTLTAGLFSSSNSNTRVLTMTGSSVVILGSGTSAWTMATSINATVNASGSTVTMSSAVAKTFSGGGLTYGTLIQGGAGALTVAGSNTFADISNTTQPATVRLTAGTTQTVSAFSLSGTSGNLITLDTTAAGTRATLSDASGIVSVSFVSIKDINATGGATWNSLTVNGNVDAGNNLGWNFVLVVDRRIIRQVFRPVFREIFHPIF
jgi:hypothetical protein